MKSLGKLFCPLVLMITLLGCSRAKEPWEIVYPVEGVLNLAGKPLAGASITLIPQDPDVPSTVRPTARSRDDGTFTLGTYSTEDGAPAGDYKVLVLRFPVIVTASNAVAGPNNLPKKYATVQTTDLTVTVNPGEIELEPLELN